MCHPLPMTAELNGIGRPLYQLMSRRYSAQQQFPDDIGDDDYTCERVAGLITKQFIHARFRPCLRINGLHDNGAGQAVAAVFGWHRSGNNN